MSAVLKVSVLDNVRQTVGATLRIDPAQIDVDARFDSIGIDSIISMELMTSMSRTLGVSMTPTQFLEVTTVRELANYIETNFSTGAPANDSAPQPAADAGRQTLLEFIRQRYSIDPGQIQFESLDELVEVLVNRNQDSLLAHYELSHEDSAKAAPAADSDTDTDVAIVGMSCRFPDAADPQQFWQNLVENRNSIRAIPDSRWNAEQNYADTARPGHTISKWGALLDGVDLFDAGFFGIPAEDAALIDPQERLLFEEAYQAFQDAGVDTARLAGSRTGVFVGYEYTEYEQRMRAQPQALRGRSPLSSSSTAYYLANRLSWAFDLRGPSESINVNCASSALSINRACQSLLSGESDLAMAGGVSLNLFADDYVALSQLGLLSAKGTCGVFDNDADGYTRGEGVAAIVLKRVADARRDNDRIYAVIKSCHQANRGRAKSLSTIRHESITDVIRECYAKAEIPSDSVSYIELSGYAKRWGDSFEFEGIRNAFRSSSAKHCALGSLKGNVGHLEPASGIASVIKVAMSLWNRKFPPSITRRTTNEFIDLNDAAHPLYFADAAIPFDTLGKDPDSRVRAGVNSFCDSGVNVHILLEEYRDAARPARRGSSTPCPLFVLSARDRARLDDYVAGFARFLSRPDSPAPLADLLYTLQTRREVMSERLAILADSREELLEKLQRIARARGARPADLEAHGIYFGNVQRINNSFITSDVTREIVQKHLQARQWRGLAQLWVNGAEVDWRAPWRNEHAQPVSLPAYPFARERHWLEFEATAMPAPATPPATPPGSAVPAEDEPAVVFHEPPRNELETRLVDLWAELLKVAPAQVGIYDNFFELGGDSLLATQVVSRMRSQLGINLPLVAFLDASNIAGAAEVIASIDYQSVGGDDEGVLEEGTLGEDAALELRAQPEARIDAPQFPGDTEQRQLPVEFNDTRAEYPADLCIHDLFAEQVAKSPDRIAVACEGATLTYRELSGRSLELALYLQSLGVQPDQLIGLCVERSPHMLVGILGILRAGGCYVPVDPNYPDGRIQHMLSDSGASIVLTQSSLQARVAPLVGAGTRVIALDSPWPKLAGELKREVCPRHLAYVIYTSGSTGTPKGVMVEHRGVVNLVSWHRKAFSFDSHTTTSCAAGLGFDACAWEVHSALCAGATLLLPPGAATRDPAQLIHWWSTQPITSGFLVTALAEQVIAHGVDNSRLTSLLMGGDQARAAIPSDLPFSVVNNYGPTETTVVATSGVCEKGSRVADIGRPISNTQVYILDPHGQPVPVGVTGEIYIGGAGVARGYLNRPELTPERFLSDPFATEPGARMYRSGDLGRWRPDGRIEFLGRNDSQVKIRGYRIELGEIEAQLAKHAAVRDAVVLARGDGDQKRLVACFTTRDPVGADAVPLRAQLRDYLRQALPEYMVPGAFLHIDALPLTVNGKVDRRALENLQVSGESGETYVAARNETEAEVVRIWAQLLNLDPARIGIHDNFFELGGNSLSATQLISKLRNQLDIEIPLTAIFNANTVAHVADAVIAIRHQLQWAAGELQIPALEIEDGSL